MSGVLNGQLELDQAIEDGTIERLQRNWYASADAPADMALALRNGVRLTCVSAAEHHGIWTPLHSDVHIYSVHGRPTTSLPPPLIPHPAPYLPTWPDENPIASLELTLLHAARCLPVSEAAILFESALNLKRIMLLDALAIVEELPEPRRTQLSRIRTDAESGTETYVRWFLESHRVSVRSQVWIPGVGRVDLLVGKGLVIECDSVRYHTDPEQFHNDRHRDTKLITLGYQSLRLTWEDVFLHWDSTQQLLVSLVRTRRQRYVHPI